MSGLEVVAAFTGILSAFVTGITLFQQWKSNRAQRREARLADQERIEEAINTSGPLVRREYDRDFRRLGNAFAVGDRKFHYLSENQRG